MNDDNGNKKQINPKTVKVMVWSGAIEVIIVIFLAVGRYVFGWF